MLDFTKNAQTEMVDYEPVTLDFIRSYDPIPDTDRVELQHAADLINVAERPFVLVGQGVELGNAQEELRTFLEKADIPCGRTLLGLSAIPSDHPLNKGMLGMHGTKASNRSVIECDLLIALGVRFSDRVTGKTSMFAKNAKIIQVDIDRVEINKNVMVDHQ